MFKFLIILFFCQACQREKSFLSFKISPAGRNDRLLSLGIYPEAVFITLNLRRQSLLALMVCLGCVRRACVSLFSGVDLCETRRIICIILGQD
jgi:hypothetical protein